MDYIVVAVLGFIGGAFSGFFLWEPKRLRLDKQARDQERQLERLKKAAQTNEDRTQSLEKRAVELEAAQKAFEDKQARLKAEEAERIETAWAEFRKAELRLKTETDRFRERSISCKELEDENRILKRDLRNLAIHVRKLDLDRDQQRQTQETLDEKIKEVGSRYLKDTVKWVSASLNPNNFATCKQRLQDVIDRIGGAGFDVTETEESALFANLKLEYQKAVRAAFEREEQARIKAQIREEQLREKEIDRELKQLEREREAIKAALEKALADAKDQHSEEVERLKARLAEAEAKSQRAISQAQLTKSGHVYVISNIGSFGDGVFKVGMTRRLEPLDRVKELGDASVPFPFDVHAMISCNDAPTLENALHRKLHKTRLNKTNPRKEFFRTDLTTIFEVVKEHHGEVEYVFDVEALQYRQSLSMSDDDQEFIESVYDDLDEENDVTVEE